MMAASPGMFMVYRVGKKYANILLSTDVNLIFIGCPCLTEVSTPG